MDGITIVRRTEDYTYLQIFRLTRDENNSKISLTTVIRIKNKSPHLHLMTITSVVFPEL